MGEPNRAVCVTGVGIGIPALPSLESLVECCNGLALRGGEQHEDSPGGQIDRYKDRATRMALKASENALENAGLPALRANQASPELFGVVVSSNLGNIDTVCRVAETIHSSSSRKTRPMDLPNASSNVVASTIAIRYGCKGVNFTLCDGAHSGIDALYTACQVIRSGRVTRMLVVGVEPLNPVVCALMGQSPTASAVVNGPLRLGEGAGALVVEDPASARERRATVLGYLAGYGYDADMDVSRSVEAALGDRCPDVDLWLTPGLGYGETAASIQRALASWGECRPRALLDLTSSMGEMYGALGVLQCIAGCLWLRDHQARTAVATSGGCWGDGSASVLIEAPSPLNML